MKGRQSHEDTTEYDTVWDCKWLVVVGVPVAGLEVVEEESGEAAKGQL